jgi:carboxyl-terminal processing protease|tara:strand:+ start:1375 stop:3087 length:1713 start_codon:yes stop_codon:yes gene_type:complete
MKNTRKLFLIGLALVSAALISLRPPIKEGFFEMSKQLEIMNSAFRELNIFYVDPLSPGELMETGITAMLKSLDPYTRYYPESKMEDVRFMSTGEYGGVGLSLNERWDGTFYVVDLKESAPAEKGGIKLGDNLIQIAGSNISHLDMSKIGELIKGTAGTDITLGIQKPSQKEVVNITLTREKIKQPDVPYFGMISDSTGYLILSKFTRTATIEVRKALKQLTDSMGAKQIVFDLRGNGGGLLREAVSIVNLFVPKGQEVVSMRGKTPEWNKSYSTSAKALLPNIPLAILLDERSASASEIVAGTLQDLDRAVIIGQESFGKGLVQQTKKLAYGSRIKITVAKYYTASGRCVQRLHYDDRDDSGDAKISADSTLATYYTRNGRPVIEGRGVIPDIELKPQTQDYVIEGLVKSGIFFDFAVNTAGDIEDSIDMDSFAITDRQWESFLNYAVEQFNDQVLENTDRTFPYEPLSKKLILDLETAMNEDGLIGDDSVDNSELISNLKTLIKPNLEVDLTTHEDDIRQVLGKEFVFHVENTSGVFKFELPKDQVALEAISTLESGNYLQILAGNTND